LGGLGLGTRLGMDVNVAISPKQGYLGWVLIGVSIYEPDTVMIARVLLISLCFSILPFLQ